MVTLYHSPAASGVLEFTCCSPVFPEVVIASLGFEPDDGVKNTYVPELPFPKS